MMKRDRGRGLERGTKAAPVEGAHLLFSFLTTDSNAIVRPIHAQAMPVILTTETECETWMAAPVEEALKLQRPLADDAMTLVAVGEKEDGLAA